MGQPGAVNRRLSGAGSPRLRLALLLSLLGHGLLWWCWPQARPLPRPPAAPALTLLAYAPAPTTAAPTPSRPARPQTAPLGAPRTTSRAPSPETSPSPAPSANLSSSPQGHGPSLDLGKIYNQARQMAKSASPAAPTGLSGDYYGSYSGGDQGSFYFHLDRNGRITGSGQSHNQGVEFLISGHVDQDGSIQMSGRGLAGAARFSGFIDASHKRVSGTWQLPGFGSGAFTGRHESAAQ